MTSTILFSLQILTNLVNNLMRKCYYHPHFTCGENQSTQTWTCPGPLKAINGAAGTAAGCCGSMVRPWCSLQFLWLLDWGIRMQDFSVFSFLFSYLGIWVLSVVSCWMLNPVNHNYGASWRNVRSLELRERAGLLTHTGLSPTCRW